MITEHVYSIINYSMDSFSSSGIQIEHISPKNPRNEYKELGTKQQK